MKSPFRYFKTSPEIIRLAVMMYVRFPLSLRNVEDLLHERGIEVSHETIRFWWNRFGPIFAAELRKKRTGRMRALSGWRWHLDEVFVKINGERHYLWRAVDQEGEVLEAFVSKKRDRKDALKFLRKLMKRYPRPDAIITDRLRSYRAALRELGASGLHQAGRWLNNRAENSHLPFRRRDHAMLRFRRMRSLQKFATVHSCRLQPLQPATTPLFTGHFQAQPRRCTCPVALAWGGLIPCPPRNNSALRLYSDSALFFCGSGFSFLFIHRSSRFPTCIFYYLSYYLYAYPFHLKKLIEIYPFHLNSSI